MSTSERMRQKWSMPSSMACVMKGCMASTTAPARFEKARRMFDCRAHLGLDREAAARIEQQPDAQAAQVVGRHVEAAQSMSCAGRLMLSRASGFDSACIINAASPTVRVIGPAARPM
jgi:hypothetical protein